MASEKLVIELWEIVQKENNEKISYDVFENDLNDALNLPRDEVDRALALMLSQAEVNPNLIGEYKGGSFVISSSFAAAITTTIKYENQFIPGTKEYDVRKNAKDNREFIDIAGVLLVSSVLDKMIDNFQELSTKERDSLLGNIGTLSLEQRIRINAATMEMIRIARERDTEGVVGKQLDLANKLSDEAKLLQEALKSGNISQLRNAYGQIDIPTEQISADELMKLCGSGKTVMVDNIDGKGNLYGNTFDYATQRGTDINNSYDKKENKFQGKEDFSEFFRSYSDEGRIISLEEVLGNNERMKFFAENLESLIIQVDPNVLAVNNNGTYQFVSLDGKEILQENLKEFMQRIRDVLKDVLPPEILVEYLEKFEQARTAAAATLAHDATRTLDIQDAVRRNDEAEVRRLLQDSAVGGEIQQLSKSRTLAEVATKLIEGQIDSEMLSRASDKVTDNSLKKSREQFEMPVFGFDMNRITLQSRDTSEVLSSHLEDSTVELEEKYLKEIDEAKEKIDLIGTPESKMQAYKTYRTLLENAKDKANEGEFLDTEMILDYISTER